MVRITVWQNQWHFLGAFSVISFIVWNLSWNFVVSAAATGCFSLLLAVFYVKIREIFFIEKKLLDNLESKAVLVTGCDSGFGILFARRLADLGLYVYATVMFPEKENALELAQHKNIEIVKLDVTKQDNIDELVRFISEDLKKNGRQFWCLVNNAGVALYSDLEVASMDHFTSTLDVNTVGPLRMCKSFLPLLRAGGQGRIVNIASQAGRFTVPFTTAYSMSKAALIAFSDGLRRELTPWNISVITIEPYFYQAAISLQYTINLIVGNYLRMWDSAPEEVKEALGERFRDARIQGLMEFCVKNQRTEDKLYEVIDDLEHAVASVRPQISYNPSTHAKLVTMLLNCLPLEVQDFLLTPVIEEKPRNIIISKMESRQRS